jgi:hypothetical protein
MTVMTTKMMKTRRRRKMKESARTTKTRRRKKSLYGRRLGACQPRGLLGAAGTLLAHKLARGRKLPVHQAGWYSKTQPTFSDAIAVVREQL